MLVHFHHARGGFGGAGALGGGVFIDEAADCGGERSGRAGAIALGRGGGVYETIIVTS